ncbi:MAG: ATP-dependent DNA helicase RecG, partial [Bryobacteraceae bacterium]
MADLMACDGGAAGGFATLVEFVDLSTPLTYVKGVGPQRSAMLEAKGLLTVEDLLTYTPFRYEDRSNVKPIAMLAPGEMATVLAEVHLAKVSGFKRKNLGMFEAEFRDGSSERLVGKWFHGGYLQNVLAPGLRVALYGKVELDPYTGHLSMLHPEFEILSAEDEEDSGLHTGRVVPIYEAAGKVTTRLFRAMVHRVLGSVDPMVDVLPEDVRRRMGMPDLWTAVRCVHFPPVTEDLRLLNSFRSPAQFRLVFEEFFWLECGMALKRAKARLQPGIRFELNDQVRAQIKKMLPFKPTGAQKKVLGEIAQDMAAEHPMNRLLQGDVGSGKTLVAAEAAIIALENGYQVV